MEGFWCGEKGGTGTPHARCRRHGDRGSNRCDARDAAFAEPEPEREQEKKEELPFDVPGRLEIQPLRCQLPRCSRGGGEAGKGRHGACLSDGDPCACLGCRCAYYHNITGYNPVGSSYHTIAGWINQSRSQTRRRRCHVGPLFRATPRDPHPRAPLAPWPTASRSPRLWRSTDPDDARS